MSVRVKIRPRNVGLHFGWKSLGCVARMYGIRRFEFLPLRHGIVPSDSFHSTISRSRHVGPQIGPQTVACWLASIPVADVSLQIAILKMLVSHPGRATIAALNSDLRIPWSSPLGRGDVQSRTSTAPPAKKLLEQMLALGISRWHPDPMAALAEAKQQKAET